MEWDYNEFRSTVTNSWKETIDRHYSSVENFAKKKGYPPGKVEKMLAFQFDSFHDFMQMLWDTNSMIEFRDCLENQVYFPEPRASDCMELQYDEEKHRGGDLPI